MARHVKVTLFVHGDIFLVVLHSVFLGPRASRPPAYEKLKQPELTLTHAGAGGAPAVPGKSLNQSVAKMAISAGMVSHNNPFKRKKTSPQNPSLLIQVFKLISVLPCGSGSRRSFLFSAYRLHPYCILPQALVFQLSMAAAPTIQGGSGINNISESAQT